MSDGWKSLRIWAEMFEDAQKARIACENRAKRGGVDTESYSAQLAAMAAAENEMGKALRKTYRKVVPPDIVAWQKDTVGIGEHLLARLLGVLGHPVHATPYHWEGEGADRVLVADDPYDRGLHQLWSYCGHGDPTRRRRKGQSAEEAAATGNPRAKMLVHLSAEACMKQTRSPYRAVYDAARERYAGREGWTDLHRHNAALRKVGKEILRGLWRAASQGADEVHESSAGGPAAEQAAA